MPLLNLLLNNSHNPNPMLMMLRLLIPPFPPIPPLSPPTSALALDDFNLLSTIATTATAVVIPAPAPAPSPPQHPRLAAHSRLVRVGVAAGSAA